MTTDTESPPFRSRRSGRNIRGIVIADGEEEDGIGPRITAFVWGGRVTPAPTLPFGRWREVA